MDTSDGTPNQPFAEEEAKRTTILLADDDRGLLESVRRLLESEFNVVACVSDGHELIEAARLLSPDLIVNRHLDGRPQWDSRGSNAEVRAAKCPYHFPDGARRVGIYSGGA